MMSIYDLVYAYMDRFYPKQRLTKEQKKTIHKEIKELLSEGWIASEILDGMKNYQKKHPDLQTLYPTKMFAVKKPRVKNLLDPQEFYIHNDLRLTVGAPKRSIDYDTGEIVAIDEPYFLEMKASYTLDDVTDYYMKLFARKKYHSEDRKRIAGSLNYLLKSYDLEDILFMIDQTVNHCISEDRPFPKTPLEIKEYEQEAQDAKHAKQTELVLSGGNIIVRKKRVRRS